MYTIKITFDAKANVVDVLQVVAKLMKFFYRFNSLSVYYNERDLLLLDNDTELFHTLNKQSQEEHKRNVMSHIIQSMPHNPEDTTN